MLEDPQSSPNNPSRSSESNKDTQPEEGVPKMREWGGSVSVCDEDSIQFIFQNVNGISRSSAIHEEIKASEIRLGAHMTALCETNINWRNHSFWDEWELKLQRNYTERQFSHSSCNEGSLLVTQRGGTSMFCNTRLNSRLLHSNRKCFRQDRCTSHDGRKCGP